MFFFINIWEEADWLGRGSCLERVSFPRLFLFSHAMGLIFGVLFVDLRPMAWWKRKETQPWVKSSCSLFIFYLLVFNRHAKETRMAGPRDQWKWRKRTVGHAFLLSFPPGWLYPLLMLSPGPAGWEEKKRKAGRNQTSPLLFMAGAMWLWKRK